MACLKVQSLAQFFIFIIYKWSSNKYRGAGTVLLADDTNILIKAKQEIIPNQKINRIIKGRAGFIPMI